MYFLLQVTIPDKAGPGFKVPRATVVHMASTATRPQHMSQVRKSIFHFSGTPMTFSKLRHFHNKHAKFFMNFFGQPTLIFQKKRTKNRNSRFGIPTTRIMTVLCLITVFKTRILTFFFITIITLVIIVILGPLLA